MANRIQEASIETTKIAINTARNSTNLARKIGQSIVRRVNPDYVSSEVRARQSILKQFEGRFGVVSNLIEAGRSERDIKSRVSSTADALVEEGFVDESTTMELRPILPEDALGDPVLDARREIVVRMLQHTLRLDHDIQAIPYTHPIMPSAHRGSAVSPTRTWGAIATELDGFSHQLHDDPHQPAMLAITEPSYAREIFEDQTAHVNHDPAQQELLVLRRVGELPRDNLLVGVR